MSLATPETIQTLQRKLYLKAKRDTSTEWEVAGSADSPYRTSMTHWVSSILPAWLWIRACLEDEPSPRAGCGQPARPVR